MRRATGLILVLLLAGCTDASTSTMGGDAAAIEAPTPLLDPLAKGPHDVASADYDAGAVEVGGKDPEHAEYEYEARLRGHVWWPSAPGQYPLIVFLHGQHSTCAFQGNEAMLPQLDDCSDDEGFNTAYPSHMGYEYLATDLASHGYVVASILGYEVNRNNGAEDVGMWARGELLLATLDAFRDRTDGMPADALDRAHLSRVGLMGHSRGGEGVVTAPHVNLARPVAERHALAGIVALAPTDFNDRGVPSIPLLSLVPYCDGDVSTLHGLRTYDHSRLLDDVAPKVQILARGTNHNFYNTRWYDETGTPVRPGDDGNFNVLFGGASCSRERDVGGWRWTPAQTQREALVHINGFLRWTVGNETGLAPWFTGERGLPDAACPGAAPCPDVIGVSAWMPGAESLLVINKTIPDILTLEGFDEPRVCAGTDCAASVYSVAPALDLTWTAPATLTLSLDPTRDRTGADVFAFRIAVPDWNDPTRPAFDVIIELRDAAGASASVRASDVSTALDRTPDPYVPSLPMGGLGESKVALQSVRVPLSDLAIDRASITEVILQFEGSGRALVTDFVAQPEPDVT